LDDVQGNVSGGTTGRFRRSRHLLIAVAAAALKVDAALAVMTVELGGTGPEARVPVRLTAPQWFCSEILLPRIAAFQKAERWIDLNLSTGGPRRTRGRGGLAKQAPAAGRVHRACPGLLGSKQLVHQRRRFVSMTRWRSPRR
jgi:hypothetical protein